MPGAVHADHEHGRRCSPRALRLQQLPGRRRRPRPPSTTSEKLLALALPAAVAHGSRVPTSPRTKRCKAVGQIRPDRRRRRAGRHWPWRTTCGMPSTRVLTTGRPAAIASSTTIGMPSPYRLGSANSCMRLNSALTSALNPAQVTDCVEAQPLGTSASTARSYSGVSKGPTACRRTRAPSARSRAHGLEQHFDSLARAIQRDHADGEFLRPAGSGAVSVRRSVRRSGSERIRAAGKPRSRSRSSRLAETAISRLRAAQTEILDQVVAHISPALFGVALGRTVDMVNHGQAGEHARPGGRSVRSAACGCAASEILGARTSRASRRHSAQVEPRPHRHRVQRRLLRAAPRRKYAVLEAGKTDLKAAVPAVAAPAGPARVRRPRRIHR